MLKTVRKLRVSRRVSSEMLYISTIAYLLTKSRPPNTIPKHMNMPCSVLAYARMTSSLPSPIVFPVITDDVFAHDIPNTANICPNVTAILFAAITFALI